MYLLIVISPLTTNTNFFLDYRLVVLDFFVCFLPLIVLDKKVYDAEDALVLVVSTLFLGIAFSYLITIRNMDMDKEKFIENFAGLFEDTDTSNFTMDTDFRDNEEWSSILGLECMAMIKMEYEVNLRGEDIMNSQTIGDLYNVVAAKKA